MNIGEFEQEIIDSLLSGEFSDIESFIQNKLDLKEYTTKENINNGYGHFPAGTKAHIPVNENDFFIKLLKYEKLIFGLKSLGLIDFVQQDVGDISLILVFNTEKEKHTTSSTAMDIVKRDRQKKLLVFSELERFRESGYKTPAQLELDKQIRDRRRAQTYTLVVSVVAILAGLLPLCINNNSITKVEIINKHAVQDSTTNNVEFLLIEKHAFIKENVVSADTKPDSQSKAGNSRENNKSPKK